MNRDWDIILQETKSSRQCDEDQRDWSNISALVLVKQTSSEDLKTAVLLRCFRYLVSRQIPRASAGLCIAASLTVMTAAPPAQNLQFPYDHLASSLCHLVRQSGAALVRQPSHVRLFSSIRYSGTP